ESEVLWTLRTKVSSRTMITSPPTVTPPGRVSLMFRPWSREPSSLHLTSSGFGAAIAMDCATKAKATKSLTGDFRFSMRCMIYSPFECENTRRPASVQWIAPHRRLDCYAPVNSLGRKDIRGYICATVCAEREKAFMNSSVVRFGAFEANFRSGELRKSGIKLKLPGQPLQV